MKEMKQIFNVIRRGKIDMFKLIDNVTQIPDNVSFN